ncbi:MAG: hypothetical protein WCY58_01815 [Mariniphaga sp.]|nr:hypothetical protein [Mariniphaga sp.]MDD4225177.1 hypothetical protein [Mariniphaga sp.]
MIKLKCRNIPPRNKLMIIPFVVFSLFTLTLQAQKDSIVPFEKNPEKLLGKIDIRTLTNNGFNFWYDDFSGHWSGVGLGFNLFLNPDYTDYTSNFMDNDIFRSNTTYINFIQQSIGIQRTRNTIGLVTGMGITLQSYRLDNNTTIQISDAGIIEPQILYFDKNQKSKLSIVSLVVPLLSEFQIPVNHYKNRIYISGGFYGGLRLSSHTKIKYRIDHKKEKLKTPGHYYLQDFKYGLMMRAGYRSIHLFATYEPVSLFRNSKGPDLTPVTFGITLISF